MHAATHRRTLPILACLLTLTLTVQAADWPQWRGPDRTGHSRDAGLLQTWPKGGPRLLWKAKGLGGGYSTPSVAAGKVYGMSFRGGEEIVWCLNDANGRELWKAPIAKANRNIGYGEGPRCTPTVDGKRLYALGVSGDLACLDSQTGKLIWQKNLQKDFGGRMMSGWGYSESPLVDGEKLIATPGGRDATLVCLNKQTGAVIWKASVPQGDGAAYSSVIAADVDGQRQYIQFLGGGVVGIAADDGRFLWRWDAPRNGTANCSTPIFVGEGVFAASGYGTGGGLVKLTRNGTDCKADEAYFTKKMKNHHGGMVVIDGHLYGADESILTCIEVKSGQIKWQERAPGKGSISFADGRLYFRNEGGPIVLVEANSEKYVEHGRFEQPDRSGKNAWPHPVIANGKLYILDQDTLLCYDIKRKN